jgi:hypothetical protein
LTFRERLYIIKISNLIRVEKIEEESYERNLFECRAGGGRAGSIEILCLQTDPEDESGIEGTGVHYDPGESGS